jgi:hypothetical protein
MEAKLAALEEEINILKGEIKSVLQEVRTAVLASENPFGAAAFARSQLPSAGPPSEPGVAPVQPQAEAATRTEPPPAPPPGHDSSPGAAIEPPPVAPAQTRVAAPAADAGPLPSRPLPDIHALAALLTWVEETRERLDETRYRIVLSLARYGALIDPDLEATLLEAGSTVEPGTAAARPSVNDSIVALRQLEAILAGPGPGRWEAPDNLRRISDYAPGYPDAQEVRPSKRR